MVLAPVSRRRTVSSQFISVADDHVAADGERVLNFAQAKRRALELASTPPPGPTTVADALAAYFARLESKGSKTFSTNARRAEVHIIPILGAVPVDSLTREVLDGWLAGVALGRDGAGPTRASRASANRVASILRAALNMCFRDGKAASDRAWKAASPFKNVDAPRERFFTQDELRRLINASHGDFRLLVKAAQFSGCRFGELARLKVGNFNPDMGFVRIEESKSGRPRDVYLTGEGVSFFTGLCAGRAGDELMLPRDGKPWLPSAQTVPMNRAMAAANITGGSFHILRHSAASWWLMSGVPLTTVARNLGHADSRLTESVYAHLAPNFRSEQMRKVPGFGILPEASTIVPFTLVEK
jgi:integrase